VSGPRLEGVRVLVTRPKERSADLVFLLEDEGAEVESLPLLELLPPDDPRPLLAAAEQIHRYAWIAFASPSGVSALADALRQVGTERKLSEVKLAAVGPRTAKAIEDHGWALTIASEDSHGHGLADSIRPFLDATSEVLVPAAQEGRRELVEDLLEAGAKVTWVAAYKSAKASLDAEVWRSLAASPPQVVLFASPRTAEAFLEGGDDAQALLTKVRRVAIGPTTARALEQLGFAPHAVAERPTASDFVEAVVRSWES
jgi:uroporphyrinogen-III synthase